MVVLWAMSILSTASALATLRTHLETQLGWGPSEGWTTYDFERLSERIEQQTGVSLSVSTLKRVVGKVGAKGIPSLTTLNTLAQFVGYGDWRDFQHRTAQTSPTPPEPVHYLPEVKKPFWSRFWLAGLFLGIVLVGLVRWLLRQPPPYTPSLFTFSSKTILTRGVPNSVVFAFDATRARAGDSVFICQSWDIRRKVLVNKDDHQHSAIYYYPGFYRAKLMVGRQVVREHDLQINTDGWLGLVEAPWGQQPLYFKPADIRQAQTVGITDELLENYGVKRGAIAPKILLVNQKRIQGIKTDAFDFDTEVKSMHEATTDACHRVEVVVHAKNDVLVVPLVEPGCIGDINLYAFGFNATSRKADLSGFGCHPGEWTRLRVHCRGGLMHFYVNQRLVYQAWIRNRVTDIIGVQVRFNSPGAVRNTWVQGATGKVFF